MLALLGVLPALAAAQPTTGNVIFIHPDGASSASWTAARALYVGPDNDLHWDRLPAIAVYRGHMGDSLTATSNGGATTHAFGVKVDSDAFGRTAGWKQGKEIVDAEGKSLSVALQAKRAGLALGLVQTGIASEPGTACFVTSVASRGQHDEIAAFCEQNYGVTFPMFSKVTVRGEEKHPLYAKLTGQPDPVGGAVKWNFQKYLVDRRGEVAARYAPDTEPEAPELVAALERLLDAPEP